MTSLQQYTSLRIPPRNISDFEKNRFFAFKIWPKNSKKSKMTDFAEMTRPDEMVDIP